MAEAIVYRRRESVLTGEDEWRADDDGLMRREPDGRETVLSWADVRFAQLRYNATGLKRWLHTTRIVSGNALMAFDNGYYRGFGDFEDRSADYGRLLRKVLERIAVAAPGADIRTGSSTDAYVMQILLVLVAFGALAAVVLSLPIPVPLTWAIAAKLLVIATGIPLAWRWLKTNRPRKLTALEALMDLPAAAAPDRIATDAG